MDYTAFLEQAKSDFEKKHKRKVAFIAITGSHTTGTQNENSDVDYKIVFYPNKEDLFMGQNLKFSSTSSERDYVAFQLNTFFDVIKKVNTDSAQMLFTEHYLADEDFEPLIAPLRNLVNMNAIKLTTSDFWCAVNMYKKSIKSAQSGNTKDIKVIANAFWRLFHIMDFIETRKFNVVLPGNEHSFVMGIKNGMHPTEEFESEFEQLMNLTASIIFSNWELGFKGASAPSKLITNMDATKTEEYKDFIKDLKSRFVDLYVKSVKE